MNAHQQKHGFTLIELMIVVTIIAILASIAYPSYREFVRRSARSEAKTALLQNAQFMEQNFTVTNRYDKDSGGEVIDESKLPVQQTPTDGTAKYDMSVTVEEDKPGKYLLSATPVAGASMENDPCGTFTLNEIGEKKSDGTFEACWGK